MSSSLPLTVLRHLILQRNAPNMRIINANLSSYKAKIIYPLDTRVTYGWAEGQEAEYRGKRARVDVRERRDKDIDTA